MPVCRTLTPATGRCAVRLRRSVVGVAPAVEVARQLRQQEHPAEDEHGDDDREDQHPHIVTSDLTPWEQQPQRGGLHKERCHMSNVRARNRAGGLHVEVWGEGTPVVLVHGSLATSQEEWEAQRPLVDEGFRFLAPDRRGYGASP